jgi:hypothetical protein
MCFQFDDAARVDDDSVGDGFQASIQVFVESY